MQPSSSAMSSSLHRRYSGYLPPVIRGFWEYYHNCALEEGNSRRLLTSRAVNRESETHPPLRDRLLRLGRLENLSLVEPAFDLINTPKLVESVRNRDTVDGK